MVLPRLIHPVWVLVERKNNCLMVMDTDAREPIHGARSVAADIVRIQAQISISTVEAPDYNVGGVRLSNTGYILCRFMDLDSVLGKDKRFTRGDKITQMGRRTGLDLYITRLDAKGHYPDQLGATLYKFYFEDRDPTAVK